MSDATVLVGGSLALALALAACGGSTPRPADSLEASGSGTGGTGGTSSGGGDGATAVSAAALLGLTGACNEITNGRYATDDGAAATVAVCQLNGALFWKADMDVDCDGIRTTLCNETTDPWFQAQTSATDSQGNFVDASMLPYVVIPLPSSRFDYSKHNIDLGSVVAVIYQGKLQFGVFADQGPDNIIGEASYAMAKSLGINPDPHYGGVDSGLTYIVFNGPNSRVAKVEDHVEAVSIGTARAAEVIANN